MSDILLSLCMIVKDEAALIGRCLASVRHAVDEIIVVDTGSSDETMEIAKSYGASIYEYDWTDNFAEARNFSIGKASGEWILWMDADEALQEGDGDALRTSVRSSGRDLLFVELLNYFGEGGPDHHRVYRLAHHRLFRNRRGFAFVNPIHEQLCVKEGMHGPDDLDTKVLPVRIHHYGYLEEVARGKKKFERNMTMLQLEKKQGNDSPWLDYHIASEYYRVDRYAEAFRHVNTAIVGFLSAAKLPPSILYHMKYAILLSTGSFEGAWPGIDKAIGLYPDYVDLHFYKGVILFMMKRYAQSIEVFRHCQTLGERCSRHLTKKGAGSFYAEYYIGRCYERIGAVGLAKAAYLRALEQYPDFEEARLELEQIERTVEGSGSNCSKLFSPS